MTVLVQKQGEALGLLDVHPPMMRLGNAALSYVKYIQKMFWPDQLAILYPYPTVIVGWQVLAALVVLGCITFLAVRYRKRFPWFFLGWFWYVGTLVPVIGLVQVGVQSMADRYTYIPLVGLFVILSWGVDHLIRNWRYKQIARSIVSAMLCVLLVATAKVQVSYWKNSIALFEHTLDVTADNYVIHTNLGFELALHGRTDEAIMHYRAALDANPEFELAHINLGSALFSQAKIEESFAYYQAVLNANPGFAGVQYNFGILLLKTGRVDEAILHFQESLRIKPDFAEAYNSLGAAMASKGKIPAAIAHFKTALQLKPDLADARTNLKNLFAHIQTDENQKIIIDFQ